MTLQQYKVQRTNKKHNLQDLKDLTKACLEFLLSPKFDQTESSHTQLFPVVCGTPNYDYL